MEPVKTQNVTDQAILALMDNLKQGKDFVLEQAPDVIQQLILYRTVREVLYVTASAALFGVAWKWWKMAKAQRKNENKANRYYVDNFQSTMMFLASIGAAAVASLSLFDSILVLIKLTLAPKVWLLEYAASIARNVV